MRLGFTVSTFCGAGTVFLYGVFNMKFTALAAIGTDMMAIDLIDGRMLAIADRKRVPFPVAPVAHGIPAFIRFWQSAAPPLRCEHSR